MTPNRLRIGRVVVKTASPLTPQQAEQIRASLRRELTGAIDSKALRAASTRDRIAARPVRASQTDMAGGVAKSVRGALGGA